MELSAKEEIDGLGEKKKRGLEKVKKGINNYFNDTELYKKELVQIYNVDKDNTRLRKEVKHQG